MKLEGPIVKESIITYYGAFDEARKFYEDDFIQESKKYKVLPREEYFVKDVQQKVEAEGVKRLKRFEDLLFNKFKYKPHYFQRGFMNMVIAGMAETIVGKEDWTQYGPTILKQRGWKNTSKLIMAKAPRRFGKSVAVGMIVISYAIVMEGSTQSIFSTGRRASRNLLEICYKQLTDLGFASWADTFNVEHLFIKNPFTGGISKIFSYPSNPKIDTKNPANPTIISFFAIRLLTIIHTFNISFVREEEMISNFFLCFKRFFGCAGTYKTTVQEEEEGQPENVDDVAVSNSHPVEVMKYDPNALLKDALPRNFELFAEYFFYIGSRGEREAMKAHRDDCAVISLLMFQKTQLALRPLPIDFVTTFINFYKAVEVFIHYMITRRDHVDNTRNDRMMYDKLYEGITPFVVSISFKDKDNRAFFDEQFVNFVRALENFAGEFIHEQRLQDLKTVSSLKKCKGILFVVGDYMDKCILSTK